MDPFGVEFGKTLGQLVGEYRTTFGWAALTWHLSTVAVMYLVVRYGNRYRRVFAAYFAIKLRVAGRLCRGLDECSAVREDGCRRACRVRGHPPLPSDHHV
jgi:hypothetical protein